MKRPRELGLWGGGAEGALFGGGYTRAGLRPADVVAVPHCARDAPSTSCPDRHKSGVSRWDPEASSMVVPCWPARVFHLTAANQQPQNAAALCCVIPLRCPLAYPPLAGSPRPTTSRHRSGPFPSSEPTWSTSRQARFGRGGARAPSYVRCALCVVQHAAARYGSLNSERTSRQRTLRAHLTHAAPLNLSLMCCALSCPTALQRQGRSRRGRVPVPGSAGGAGQGRQGHRP